MFKNIQKLANTKTLCSFLKRNIAVGQHIPKAEVTVLEYKNGAYEKKVVSTDSLFSKGKVVLVGYPGAFTPDCTKTHIPEYIKQALEIKKAGVNHVYAVAVNDPFVTQAFAEKLEAKEQLTFIADHNGEFTKKLDTGAALEGASLGFRSRRYSLLINEGKVTQVNDEQGPKMTDLSRVGNVLKQAAAK